MDLSAVEEAIAAPFSGVVRIDRPAEEPWIRATGFADRRHAVPCAADTRFGMASAAKTLTALTVLALVAEDVLALDTPVRRHLGADLPLVDDRVTIEHLLCHRSGIGDYFDESQYEHVADFQLPVPAQRLETTEDYLAVLDGQPMVSRPGERFAYNNGGFVILSLVAERAARRPFPELVAARVTGPAGMADTEFCRSDALPERTATGYLSAEGWRTNVFHLPMRGAGDGGVYSTLADLHALWRALFGGRLIPAALVERMTTPASFTESGRYGYGFGVWLPVGGSFVQIEGADAGVSVRSTVDRTTGIVATVLSNVTDAAWPVASAIETSLGWGRD